MHFHLIKITKSYFHPPIFLSSCLPVSFTSGHVDKCCRLDSRFNRSRHQCHVSSPWSRFTASCLPPASFIYIFFFKTPSWERSAFAWRQKDYWGQQLQMPNLHLVSVMKLWLFGVLLLFWLLLLSILLSGRSHLHTKFCIEISRSER